jgi:hypothetical protein
MGGRARRFGTALGIALRLRRFVNYTGSTQELAERGELLRRIVCRSKCFFAWFERESAPDSTESIKAFPKRIHPAVFEGPLAG